MIKRIIFFCFSLILISCESEQKEYSITFVFDKPVVGANDNKYPKYFNELSIGFSTECNIDYFPKPINILRLDISNTALKTNAWYNFDIKDNDLSLDNAKIYLAQYFNDSTNAYLYMPSVNKIDIDNWIENNKKNLYIFSEELTEDEYKGIPIYHTTKDLVAILQSSACKDSLNKIVILVNPILGNIIPPTPPTPVKEVEEEKTKPVSGGAIQPPPPPPTKTEKCNAQLSASSIEDWLYKLTSTSFDDCRKDNLASNYSEFFESNAKVVLVDNIGNPMQTFSSVSSYVSRIRGKNRKIKIDDENSIVNGSRYTKLAVREP